MRHPTTTSSPPEALLILEGPRRDRTASPPQKYTSRRARFETLCSSLGQSKGCACAGTSATTDGARDALRASPKAIPAAVVDKDDLSVSPACEILRDSVQELVDVSFFVNGNEIESVGVTAPLGRVDSTRSPPRRSDSCAASSAATTARPSGSLFPGPFDSEQHFDEVPDPRPRIMTQS